MDQQNSMPRLLASLALADEPATAAFACKLASLIVVKDIIALSGELGAGKTAFARSFINALPHPRGEVGDEEVPSPTFTLVQIYDRLPASVWHVDLYRLSGPEEAYETGLEEAFASAITLIEWPERLQGQLPPGHLRVSFAFADGPTTRLVQLFGGPGWAERLQGSIFHA